MKNFHSQKSNRRLRSSTKDRISDLPNSVIQHILSLLPVKDAIRFCTLSRQWDCLWTTIPNLLFHCESVLDSEVLQFASFIEKTLMVYTSSNCLNETPKLKKFSLEFFYHYSLKDRVDSWINFATSRKVEELCVHFQLRDYELSEFLYTNCWTSLKVLSLGHARFKNNTIRTILLGCPLIECLALKSCKLDDTLGVIDATSTSLKELIIDGYMLDHYSVEQEINISGPNLLSLTITGYIHKLKLTLGDVSSLVEVNIGLKIPRVFYTSGEVVLGKHQNILESLLLSLHDVNKLTVGFHSLQALSFMQDDRERYSTSTCKILKVYMELSKKYLPGFLALLYSSPGLEQLIMNVMPSEGYEFAHAHLGDNDYFVEKNHLIWHLKSVEITGFVVGSSPNSDEILIELVQYLLANAKVLKKLIIHSKTDNLKSKPRKLMKLLEITRTLLRCPRASPDAAVVLEGSVY